jgi:hypothetical protein
MSGLPLNPVQPGHFKIPSTVKGIRKRLVGAASKPEIGWVSSAEFIIIFFEFH